MLVKYVVTCCALATSALVDAAAIQEARRGHRNDGRQGQGQSGHESDKPDVNVRLPPEFEPTNFGHWKPPAVDYSYDSWWDTWATNPSYLAKTWNMKSERTKVAPNSKPPFIETVLDINYRSKHPILADLTTFNPAPPPVPGAVVVPVFSYLFFPDRKDTGLMDYRGTGHFQQNKNRLSILAYGEDKNHDRYILFYGTAMSSNTSEPLGPQLDLLCTKRGGPDGAIVDALKKKLKKMGHGLPELAKAMVFNNNDDRRDNLPAYQCGEPCMRNDVFGPH